MQKQVPECLAQSAHLALIGCVNDSRDEPIHRLKFTKDRAMFFSSCIFSSHSLVDAQRIQKVRHLSVIPEGIRGGAPKDPELPSGGWAPWRTGFPHQVSVLGTHLDQCTSWRCCERLCPASVNFFEDSYSAFAHFMMSDLQGHLPTPQ